ncbi:hypothetical protein [uncultured Draconibacterium sp.]|uniref:hypothetical protein n=1 Tax=uncultured Draconibacterium sp. TaxID=1573823 RepID=UPI0029C6E988|nr:hypothetical protein [uncultured Draconibacterium sp.]
MKLKNTILSLCCVFAFSLTIHAQQKLSDYTSVVRKIDFQPEKTQLSPVALRAIQQGEVAGEFKGVREEFTSKVKMLTPAQKAAVQQGMKSDGVVNTVDLATFSPNPENIYVDPASDLVMQFAPVADGELMVLQPQLNMVFEEFTIPDQEVGLTLANTSETMPNTDVKSTKSGNNYDMVMEFDSTTFEVQENGVTMKVALVGSIAFANPRIEGHYSKNNGYKFVFKTGEQINMKVYAEMKYKKEIEEPIWGFKIKAGDYGQVDLGVFMVIDLEGKVNLEVRVDQGFEIEAGLRGNTTYYFPTGIRPVIEVNNWCDIDYTMAGEIKAFAGVKCKTKLKVKGYKVLEVSAKTGMEGKVETDGKHLVADIGMRMKINANALSKNFTLLDKYYSFFQTRELDYGNYKMEILEACAYGDYVVGHIETIDSHQPYTGNLSVSLQKANGSSVDFPCTSNNDGYFAIRNVPMKKGDKVAIKIPGVANLSEAISPSIPFNEIKLMYADYYTNKVNGMIAGKVSQYKHLLPSQGNNANAAAIAAINQTNPAINSSVLIQHNNIQKLINNFKNSIVAYKGEVSVNVRNLPVATPIGASNNSESKSTKNAVRTIPKPVSAVKFKAPVSASKAVNSTKHLKNNSTTVSSPLGIFTINNIDLKPGDKVQAKAIIEGFEVKSEWLITDGLLVTPIATEELTSSMEPRRKTVSAKQSVAIVSALRSNLAPTGKVHMVLGQDMIHDAIAQPYSQVSGFNQLKKPFLWFDKQTDLVPIPNSNGVSLAKTGEWSAGVNYTGIPNEFSPFATGSHAFEMVSYNYEEMEVGIKSYQEECPGCKSPLSFIEGLDNKGSFGLNSLNNQHLIQDATKIPKQIPKQQQIQGVYR